MEGENKSDSSLPQEAQIPFLKAPSVAVVVADQHRTGISARLEAALEAAKPANRSADLVPLNHVYDVRRRELNALVLSAEKYHQALSQLAKARTDMAIQYADLAAKSPIFGPIGNLHGGGDSLVSVARAASNQAQSFTESYKERVVDYCVEWEAIVSTRIDDELKETKQLNKRLNHYQSKVAGLRTKVNHYNGTSTEAPSNLSTKLARNEVKLESAWKVHEQAASRLCNLIDEVTLQGWMDLYPLVVASMKWEVERASAELEAISKLQSVTNDLEKEFEKNSISVELTSRVPIAVETNNVSESETAASLNREEEDDDSSSQGSEGVVTAEDNVDGAPTLKRSDSLTIISATPLSPNEVAQKGGGWWPLH